MRGVNKVILVGNLGADPEVRYSTTGTAIANFRIATSETWSDANGEDQEHTEWHSIVAWRKLGEICGEFLKKGKQVFIEGRLQNRSWEDKEGNKRWTTEVVAANLVMLGGPGDQSGRMPEDQTGGMPGDAGGPPPEADKGEDDIPF